MKARIHGATATVTLTAREAQLVRSYAVPAIYAPGGMGPDMPLESGGTVPFGGACFVNVEANLRLCLAAFRTALATEIARRDAATDERAGFDAFPAGRWMDARRGTKSAPEHVRCPFKHPARIDVWTRGYEAAMAECRT